MSKPWFRFFPSDWTNGVAGLSAAERGVYVSLLAAMYDHEGLIERNDIRLARMCGLPVMPFKRALGTLIEAGKIILEDGHLSNNRAKLEVSYRESRIVATTEGARLRWQKDKQNQCQKSSPAYAGALLRAHASDTDTDTDTDKKERNPLNVPLIAVAEMAPARTVGRKVPRRSLPDDFPLSDQMLEIGSKYKLTPVQIRFEFEKFTAHARMTGRMVSNWNQAWRMWVIKAREIRFEKEPFSQDRPVTITSLRSPA